MWFRLRKIGTASLWLASRVRVRIGYRLKRRTRDEFCKHTREVLHGDFAVSISDIIGMPAFTLQQHLKKASHGIADVAERTRLRPLAVNGNGIFFECLIREHRDDASINVTHARAIHIEGADDDCRHFVELVIYRCDGLSKPF